MKRSWILALLAAVVALALMRRVAVTDTSADEARAAAVTLTDAVTFTRDVAPLLQQHCQECHRPGQIAPFALLNWEQAYSRREKIRKVVTGRRMPPWKPVAGYGEFHGARGLSATEIAAIESWVKAGAPQGNLDDLPAPRVFADAPPLGTPDLTLTAEVYTAPGQTGDIYRCLVVNNVFAETRYVTGVEFVPGNRKIVHHAIAYIDTSGYAVELDRRDPGPGYTCFGGPGFRAAGYLGGWTPGSRPWGMPAAAGLEVRRGARLVFQMHYHNDDAQPEADASAIRLYFAKEPIDRRVHFARVIDTNVSIPAGAKRHELDITWPVRRDMELIAIHPHMHLLGREMKVWATLPDSRVVPLIYIDDWDFDWQGFYFYRTRVRLAQGARIDLKALWDNSADNPRNPNRPPQRVTWGERTTDEMGHAAILYTLDDERLNYRPQ